MNYRKVVVAGGGILGSQIAFQCAYCGYDVVILTVSENDKPDINDKLIKLKKLYVEVIDKMNKGEMWARGIAGTEEFRSDNCVEHASNALHRISIETSQEKALIDADLLIETITENIDIKINFYKQISKLLEDKTIIVTNSSTLLPSKLAPFTGRPDRFLTLHFANSIYKNNTVEIMGHKLVDVNYFDEIRDFANSINMIPLILKEEKSGYLLNSMLVPFLLSAMDLLANGISDVESIDKAWTFGVGVENGPFRIMDTVGLVTVRNIVEQYQKVPKIISPLLKKMLLPYNYKGMLKILDEYIKENKLGKSTGEGFYKYDK